MDNQHHTMRLAILVSLLVSATAFVPPPRTHNDSFRGRTSISSTTEKFENTVQDETTTTRQELSIDQFRVELDQFSTEKDVITGSDDFSTPAEYDKTKFQLDDNVQFWRDFNRNGLMKEEEYRTTIANVANRFVQQGNKALSYWLRHSSRTGYFFINAALGVTASTLNERFRSTTIAPGESFTKNLAQPRVIHRLLADVALCYEQDYKNIQNGKYKAPYDMYTINSQNSNPFFIGRQTSRFIREGIETMTRRNRASDRDKRVELDSAKHGDLSIYPEYYKTAFHYQTEGWLSQESANVYETSTETLFLGRQDAMQRTALVPLVEYSKGNGSRQKLGRPMRVLEVACGTGRFATFVRDNLPADTEVTVVDLSPFYLEKAKQNDQNWRSIQRNKRIKPLNIIQANGEHLPFADSSFDAVVCMYLYHEIPRDVRSQISAEMERVTGKGGRVILTDSLQKGDRPIMDDTMGNFEKMNEPFYCDYIEDFLPKHFEAVGLECLTKSICGSTKTLTFGKTL